MPLAVRIIPVILSRNGSLVKGKRFDSWRSVGHPLQAARIHASRSVDEILYLDIGRKINLETIEQMTRNAFIPVTVGGGVRSVEDVTALLRAGADKVSICTSHEVIPEASERFGRQAIVAGVDVLGKKVVVQCGRSTLPWAPVAWAKKMERHGAGEILLQSIDRDGMMKGYDLKLIKRVSEAVSIPVIASCGCGTYAHMLEAVRAGASAVAAGAMFQFTDQTPKEAAQYLQGHDVSVRL